MRSAPARAATCWRAAPGAGGFHRGSSSSPMASSRCRCCRGRTKTTAAIISGISSAPTIAVRTIKSIRVQNFRPAAAVSATDIAMAPATCGAVRRFSDRACTLASYRSAGSWRTSGLCVQTPSQLRAHMILSSVTPSVATSRALFPKK
jgi:hypothetical protein